MQECREGTTWFYVDESGDPAFYGKGGRTIVGEEGCSRIFLLGYVETADVTAIEGVLSSLRQQIADDAYLKPIPSVAKSLRAFHAKDDCPEVRMLVYQALAKLEFTAQVVVARKIEPMFRTRYQGNQDRFYDDLVTRLFQNRLHRYQDNLITFARRGKKARQHAMRRAIEDGVARFQQKWGVEVQSSVRIETSQPMQAPLLQVVDYTNWAVYRAFERGEMRYFDFLREKFELVFDVFDRDKYKGGGNWYTRDRNPFDIKKASPLADPARQDTA